MEFLRTANEVGTARSIPALTPYEMKESMTIRDGGWTINKSELSNLSEQTDPVGWDLQYSFDDQSDNVLYDCVRENLESNHPTVVGVDPARLRNKGIDGGHAIVATGLTSQEVVVNDPWGPAHRVFDRDSLANAWNKKGSLLITIDLASDHEDSDATVREI